MFFKRLRAYAHLSAYLIKMSVHVVYGIWKISTLKYAPVTVFGGTRLKRDSKFMKDAMYLAHMLARSHIPVLTGGGPGIMEAASCGALIPGHLITSIGVTVKGLEPKRTRR